MIGLMLTTWESQTIAIILAAIVVGLPVGMWRFGKWMKRNVAIPLKDVPHIKLKVDGLLRRFTPVEEQFFRNHGTSLRDSNDRTEALVRAAAEKLDVDVDAVAPPVVQEP